MPSQRLALAEATYNLSPILMIRDEAFNLKMNGLRNGLSIAATLLLVIISPACSRKAAEVAPPPPEVLVATAVPRDVPVVHEASAPS